MREKLIELLHRGVNYHTEAKERWILDGKKTEEPRITGSLADHLLANGVIVLPCKVGDTVWVVDSRFIGRETHKNPIIRCEIDEFAVGEACVYAVLSGAEPWFAMSRFKWVRTEDIGKTVFLTREEAEAALKEGQG